LCDACGIEPPVIQQVDEKYSATISERELTDLMQARSSRDEVGLNFMAAGAVHRFIPASIRLQSQQLQITNPFLGKPLENQNRTLQQGLQTLTGMAHCSLFNDDLVSVLASLIINGLLPSHSTRCKVLIPATVAPGIRNALRTQLKFHPVDLVVVDYDKQTGCLSPQQLQAYAEDEIAAVIMAWPNFFSVLEDVAQISRWTRQSNASLILLSDPLSLTLLQSPYQLAQGGIDFMLGELQSVGLAAGWHGHSPTYLMSATELQNDLARRAEEQIPDTKLAVIHSGMALLGNSESLQSAAHSHQMLELLVQKLSDIPQISLRFSSPFVHECVIQIASIDLERALQILSGHNILPGYLLRHEFPELSDCLLIYCSDLHTPRDVDRLAQKITTVVKNLSTAGCPVKPKF